MQCRNNQAEKLDTKKRSLFLQLIQSRSIRDTFQRCQFQIHCLQNVPLIAFQSANIGSRKSASRAQYCMRHPDLASLQFSPARKRAALFVWQPAIGVEYLSNSFEAGALLSCTLQCLPRYCTCTLHQHRQ